MPGLVVAALVALRCSPPPDLPPCQFTPAPIGELAFVRRKASVKLQVNAECPAGRSVPRVKTFSTAVFDPENRAVEHTTEVDSAPGPNATGVVVSFTPSRPGSWYLSATLEPNLGTVQGTVIVVGEGGDGGSAIVDWPQHPECAGLDVTANGTLICFERRDAGGMVWTTHRAGVPDEQHQADAVAVEGDRLWELDQKTLRGWQSESTGLRLTHEVEAPVIYEPRFPNQPAIASSRGLPWIFTNMRLIAGVAEPDGGLGLEQRDVRGPDGGPIGFPGALVASGEEVLMMTCAPKGCVGFVIDGPTPMAIEAGAVHAGTELGLVWTSNQGRLEAFTPTFPSASAARASLAASAQVERPAGVRSNVPLVRLPEGAVAVPRLVGSDVHLEVFDAGTDFGQVSAASTHHVFAWSKDGARLKVLAR